MKHVFLSIAFLALATAARAQCAGGLIVNCPAAVSPQSTDLLLGWQLGQIPHVRVFTPSQIGQAAGGVSCSGTPSASYRVTNGIVTHC